MSTTSQPELALTVTPVASTEVKKLIDYVSSMQGSGFTFKNPNATGGCGCGSSFAA